MARHSARRILVHVESGNAYVAVGRTEKFQKAPQNQRCIHATIPSTQRKDSEGVDEHSHQVVIRVLVEFQLGCVHALIMLRNHEGIVLRDEM